MGPLPVRLRRSGDPANGRFPTTTTTASRSGSTSQPARRRCASRPGGTDTVTAASISVYPDSDKLGVRPSGGGPDRLDFRRGDAVDYWDGE